MTFSKNKKKILFLIGRFGVGGKERQLAEVIKNLPPHKYDLYLFAKSFDNGYFDKDISRFVRPYILEKNNFSIGDLFYLNRVINEVKPDIVFSWASTTSHMAACTRLLAGKKQFVLLNGSIQSAPVSLSRLAKIERFLYRFYRYVISNSEAGLRAYHQEGKKGRFILSNGFDFARVPRISQEDARRDLELPADVFIVPMVARIDDAKDHKTFMDAVKLFTAEAGNSLFLIVGDGYLREHYEKYLQELSLEPYIRFLGNRSDVEKILVAADISVLISTPEVGEGLSNSVIESLAAKTPVIVTDNPGNRELLEGGTCGGVIVESKDAQAVAKMMLKYYNAPGLVRQMGVCGYQIVQEKYSLEAMLAKLEDVFCQILA